MPTKIKICGLTKPEDMDVLNALQVELAGFVFYKASPRHLSQDRAAQLAARCRPEMERVALLVDPSDDEVDMAIAFVVVTNGTPVVTGVTDYKDLGGS